MTLSIDKHGDDLWQQQKKSRFPFKIYDIPTQNSIHLAILTIFSLGLDLCFAQPMQHMSHF